MAATPEQAELTMIKNLEEKTGRSLAQWIKLAKASKLVKHGELVKMLKADHGLTHGYANLVAHKMLKSDAGSSDDAGSLIDGQYAGPKAGLRPIYDALIKTVNGFGSDVEVAPKKAYVSLRRKKQFAIIQPSTKDRVDVGMNLKGTTPTDRLENSGSFNAMVSHRVRVASKSEVDAELKCWLRAAYDAA